MGCAWSTLTPREQGIVVLLCRGCTHKEAAALLGISHETVGNHVNKINRKMGTRGALEIVIFALTRWTWIVYRRELPDIVLYG